MSSPDQGRAEKQEQLNIVIMTKLTIILIQYIFNPRQEKNEWTTYGGVVKLVKGPKHSVYYN